ncbi:hydantoinase/oxoprolinase family protein [Planctomicrobium piriforme]|uniref:Hydantoinase A/oxoprolinase domain-containing protein n=1 Tax=Planctomicrobium piriforme TaxID=1576369 RepID=A0A1I3NLY7_9PLAN|nr:hydantoinase/oxoprolinase family protein [Planctomicrobium piriforme]SFJ09970.1 hypothetical protein SAMN05421753_115133 [Planctomicrobium piriforme]
MTAIGLDIGGANLKASDGTRAVSTPFPLWQNPNGLAAALEALLSSFSAGSPLAVTMTGELVDCFETKEEGVRHILSAVEKVADGRQVLVWQTGGEFVSIEDAIVLIPLVAAANWHALATWAGRMCPLGRALVFDIGSTTTDIIPIEDGLPAAQGLTDRERLATGELLYLGVRRTPLACLLGEVVVQGIRHGVARELFATTLDVHLLRGEIDEDPDCRDTANGRLATRSAATDRMARMICCDRDEVTAAEIQDLAACFFDRELELVVEALRQGWPVEPPVRVLVSGAGEFLARLALEGRGWTGGEVLSLGTLLGPELSRAACAVALSRLAAEHLSGQRLTFF